MRVLNPLKKKTCPAKDFYTFTNVQIFNFLPPSLSYQGSPSLMVSSSAKCRESCGGSELDSLCHTPRGGLLGSQRSAHRFGPQLQSQNDDRGAVQFTWTSSQCFKGYPQQLGQSKVVWGTQIADGTRAALGPRRIHPQLHLRPLLLCCLPGFLLSCCQLESADQSELLPARTNRKA